MPELPEVETVRRVLEKSVVNLKITDVKIKYPQIILGDSKEFISNVISKRIKEVLRCGKHLIFKLDEGNIISHLRMEGKYFYLPEGSLDNKHVHVIFYFDNGYMLLYQDVRKFGRMGYKRDSELYTTEPLSSLGADPVKGEATPLAVYESLRGKKIAIKTALLDQSVITGLGNIYVDEVLFAAKINPHMNANNITYAMAEDIIKYSNEIMSKAIELGGTTIRSYTSSLGVEGSYQNYLKVHTKAICPLCGEKIIKDKTNGRGTYYCPKCQKL